LDDRIEKRANALKESLSIEDTEEDNAKLEAELEQAQQQFEQGDSAKVMRLRSNWVMPNWTDDLCVF